jgi:hypothetical protein
MRALSYSPQLESLLASKSMLKPGSYFEVEIRGKGHLFKF